MGPPTNDADFQKKLLAAFRDEAGEHIQAMSKGLLELENAPGGQERPSGVETIFREAHSLKGAARAVDMEGIESVCQALESVFAAWKRGEIDPAPPQFDVMHEAVDSLGRMLEAPEAPGTGIPEIVTKLDAVRSGAAVAEAALPPATAGPVSESPVTQSPEPSEPQPARTSAGRTVLPETIRIATAKLDALLLEAEDMVSLKLVAEQRAAELNDALSLVRKSRKRWTRFSAEVGANSPDDRTREFIDWSQANLQALESRIASLARSAAQDRRMVGTTIDNLLENTKKLVMLPVSTLLESFPKLARDLARDEEKNVRLEMRGGDVEIDKRVLEEMKDPLVHLLRNAVDHGIEKPAERERQGKPAHGRIEILVSQVDGGTVEIVIADDGAGIDPEAVKQSSLKQGILTPEDAAQIGESDAVSLIFRSGVSTSAILSEVSGRGLGMAIVREKVEKMGGRVSVNTAQGKGSSFRILLPLTLSTFRGILVEAATQTFVVPAASVDRVLRIKPGDIHSVENRESISVDGQAVSFVRLADALELPLQGAGNGGWIPVLILVSSQERVAFAVDRVLGEQEILVKPLGKPLLQVRNVAGATVLGSGKAVPILNAHDLLETAAGTTRVAAAPAPAARRRSTPVLVVEDSITSRMLLKNILESAGYEVRTAVDGVDAWTALRTEPFDLVVSDVEMPRMNGFDLTARIRADKRLSQLPVVLVTAREAREDRERGIDVGASAYVVKSSFDQSNLLEIVGRLV